MTAQTTVDHHRYSALKPQHWSYFLTLLITLGVILIGGYTAHNMEHAGHHITGMNNQIVWGLPHVFALSLIVSASGALNGATLSSVFGLAIYKPFARLSIVLALSLLVGGLLVLVLDLGRPDRLIVAMTHYNFRSIFAWNIFLYPGFVVIGIGYLWVLMERRLQRFVSRVGCFALFWRLTLTTATGSIFGFLVGRNALDSAIMAPLFIALSLVMGTAMLSLLLLMVSRWQGHPLNQTLVRSLEKYMLWFLLAVLYLSVVHHLTNLYVAEHWAVERYTLLGGLSTVFWLGHIVIGIVLPLVLIYLNSRVTSLLRLTLVSVFAFVGGSALIYVIVIGSQSTPQRLFPGHPVLPSRFGDADTVMYSASVWEWGLGFGGMALALLLCLIALRILPFAPSAPTTSGE